MLWPLLAFCSIRRGRVVDGEAPDPWDLHQPAVELQVPRLLLGFDSPPVVRQADDIDVPLGGGIRRGQLSEVVGPRSAGRTTILCGMLAAEYGTVEVVVVEDGVRGWA